VAIVPTANSLHDSTTELTGDADMAGYFLSSPLIVSDAGDLRK